MGGTATHPWGTAELGWVRALCRERSWEIRELGYTGAGSGYLSIPAHENIPCQQGPKKISGRESQAPTAILRGDNVLRQHVLYLAPDTSSIGCIQLGRHHRWAEAA